MSIAVFAAIAIGVLFVGCISLLGCIALVAWLTSGKKKATFGQPKLSAFEQDVADALALDNEATWQKAKAYDLAKKQELLAAVRAHTEA